MKVPAEELARIEAPEAVRSLREILDVTIWAEIPSDAIDWFRSLFNLANKKTSERLINVPNIRETSLDDGLIESLTPYSSPRLLPSGAIVGMQVHNIGGLRRVRRWETADIAVLVFIYRNGHLAAQKIGLLQSKRLYPENNDIDDDDPLGFLYGLNAFLQADKNSPFARLNRTYLFQKNCVYGALKAGDDQVGAVEAFNQEFGESIYYLFYNPPQVPLTIHYPIEAYHSVMHAPLGCRVYSAQDVGSVLAELEPAKSPTMSALEDATTSNWRLETWAADLLLRCSVGKEFGDEQKDLISSVIARRSGPIGAAIAISISLPQSS